MAELQRQIEQAGDPEVLYRLGLAALESGRPRLAQLALERVVAMQPRFAGAWIDLALATQRGGDSAAAVEHLEYLRGQFALPQHIRAIVDSWLLEWQGQSAARLRERGKGASWHGELFVALGHDSNANAGIARDQIPLTLAGGSSLFFVSPEYRPKPSAFGLLGLAIRGVEREFDFGKLTPLVLVRGKQVVSASEYDTLDLQAGVLAQPVLAGLRDWQFAAVGQHYRLGGAALFNAVRLNVKRDLNGWRCQSSLGGEVEWRQHERIAHLGGTLYSAIGGLVCPVTAGGQLSGSLKLGREQPQGERPGGANAFQEMAWQYQHAFSPQRQIQAGWQWTRVADAAGYSPVQENNASRRVTRQTASLIYRQMIDTDWEFRLSYEQIRQSSNLPLFGQNGQLLMLGVAYRFSH